MATPCYLSSLIDRMKILGSLQPIQWLKRSTSGTDPNTGKPVFVWEESSLYAFIDNVSIGDVPLEPGITVEDVRRIRTCESIKQFDRLKIDGCLFEIGVVEEDYIGDTFLCYSALAEKLKMEVAQ
jgi:hypothetical protein